MGFWYVGGVSIKCDFRVIRGFDGLGFNLWFGVSVVSVVYDEVDWIGIIWYCLYIER